MKVPFEIDGLNYGNVYYIEHAVEKNWEAIPFLWWRYFFYGVSLFTYLCNVDAVPQWFQQIKKIVSLKQKTILFTSHDLNSAIQICDKILLLLADRWEFGTPDELIQGGVFQTVFPKETVGFDPLQKQFKICI